MVGNAVFFFLLQEMLVPLRKPAEQDSSTAKMPVIILVFPAVQSINLSTFTLACSHIMGKLKRTLSLALQIVLKEEIKAATS